MYRWMYDCKVEEYLKMSKKDLANRIMAGDEIELKDRCFANGCISGGGIYNINELFRAIDDLRNDFSYEKLEDMFIVAVNAMSSWRYIRSGLERMDNGSRTADALECLIKRVNEATEPMDTI